MQTKLENSQLNLALPLLWIALVAGAIATYLLWSNPTLSIALAAASLDELLQSSPSTQGLAFAVLLSLAVSLVAVVLGLRAYLLAIGKNWLPRMGCIMLVVVLATVLSRFVAQLLPF